MLLHAEFILAMVSICINEARYIVQSVGCGGRVNSMKCLRAGRVSSQCLLPLHPQGLNLTFPLGFLGHPDSLCIVKNPITPRGGI